MAECVLFPGLSYIAPRCMGLMGVIFTNHVMDGVLCCVVVLRAENGRFAAAYNDDGFSSFGEATTNRNGFILSIKEDGSCGAQFDRNESRYGTFSNPNSGPDLYNDLFIFSNCHENELSRSLLGRSYGSSEVGADKSALFGQSG
jgi:hypothetical protein